MTGTGNWILKAAAVGLALSSLGCANGKKSALERDRLLAENQELRTTLDRAYSDRDAAESDRDRLVGEVNRMQNDTEIVSVASNTGFEVIPGIEIDREHGMIKVRVPGDVLFAPGRASLRTSAKHTLDQIASVIQGQYPGSTIGVEGFTDADPIRKSKWKDNLELSLHRAAAVNRYLRSRGINPKTMYAAGWGAAQPKSSKSKSRRVEIVVLSS